MSETSPPETRAHEFGEVAATGVPPGDQLGFEDLKNLRLTLTVDLGHTTMLVREILDMKPGSVVPLEKLAGETSDICVNDVPMAKGEIVVIGDSLHVRIAEVLGVDQAEKEAPGDED